MDKVWLGTYPKKLVDRVEIDAMRTGAGNVAVAGSVPVEPVNCLVDRAVGYALWEYAVPSAHPTHANEVRACLLWVEAAALDDGPGWRIDSGAGDERNGRYYERHIPILGKGVLSVTSRDGHATARTHMHAGQDSTAAVEVLPGQSFRLTYDHLCQPSDPVGRYGAVAVLATFPGAPFSPAFETKLSQRPCRDWPEL